MSLAMVVGIQLVVVGVVLFALTPAMRRRWPAADGFVALARIGTIVAGIAFVAIGLSGGQTPMSGTPNPVSDQVTSVDAGADLYQANCAACHGVDGNGGGPLSGTTAITPPSLKAHLAQHTDGDLYYWISNGLPGGMPAWSDKFSETDRWNLVNYLRSINGVGPSAQPSASASASAVSSASSSASSSAASVAQGDRLAFLFPVGFAAFFSGWLVSGYRRSRHRATRASAGGRSLPTSTPSDSA